MLSNFLQLSKAISSIVLTDGGRVRDFSSSRKRKASRPMVVTPSGTVDLLPPITRIPVAVSITALQLFLLSYLLFAGLTVISESL